MTTRRDILTTGAALVAGTTSGLALHPLAQAAQAQPGAELKILRYAFLIAETGFDPAQISDLYSRTVAAGMFEAPLEFAFMAQPAQMRPNTTTGMPEVSADFQTFTFHLKPGTYFADDPAFNGKKRELVAEDYVFSIKRHYDPRWKSANLYLFENAKILGLSELRKQLMADKKPFDYDAPVEGLRALDRYSFQVRLGEPSPRFLMTVGFADGSVTGAMAREVVELYGDKIPEHPVGTGPFVLKSWRRSSRIVLAKNPNYREELWDETPPAGNTRLQAAAQKLKGKRLPMVDEVHISIIEEAQPRWLSFNAAEQDVMDQLPADFAPTVIPNNKLAPHLEKRGITVVRYPRADVSVSYFGMENPVVGGYEPHKVALRRAISLAVDLEREIRLVRRGQAIPGQGVLAPGCYGYDANFKSESSDYNLSRAKALLDLHGYVDKNGDGWREQPNGEALVLEYATSPDATSRQLNEQWKRNMNALGLQISFKTAKWPENLKASRAGKLMMWGVGWSAGAPDGDTFLALGYGPNKGGANHSRFNLPAFNAVYEKQRVMPDGPERLALMKQAQNLMVAYMPYKVHAHRIFTDLAHPWVVGYHRNVFVREFYKYLDIDLGVARQYGIGVA
jgi:ABC-type transport system substrate-binding protein